MGAWKQRRFNSVTIKLWLNVMESGVPLLPFFGFCAAGIVYSHPPSMLYDS